MTNWIFITASLFLAFFFYITWGAWQGYFSPVLPPSQDPSQLTTLQNQKAALLDTVQTAKDALFDYENNTAENQAKIADLQRAIQTLMDEINRLTTQIAALQDENATLRKGLKEALEQLDITRKQLMQCRTREEARRLSKQYCDTTPSSNMLF